jgi:hypothetical protein
MKLAPEITRMTPDQLALEAQRGARFVIYQYCISVVVLTFRRNSPIQFIPAGQSPTAKGMPWTLLSFFLGWWGFPFGLIYTPMVLYKNLNGGIDVTQNVLSALSANRTQSA